MTEAPKLDHQLGAPGLSRSPASINRARMLVGSRKLVSNITEARHVAFSVVRSLGGFVMIIELTVTVGKDDGRVVGSLVIGDNVGSDVVGVLVGEDCVGTPEGTDVVGSVDGVRLGLPDGDLDGAAVGMAEVGELDGTAVGIEEIGELDGAAVVGRFDGAGVGEEVGAMATAKKCVFVDVLEEYAGADTGAMNDMSLSCWTPPISGSPKRLAMASIGMVKLAVP